MASPPEPCKPPHVRTRGIVVTLSSKAELAIPERSADFWGSRPGSRLAMRLRDEGLELRLEPSGKTANAWDVIGCSGYRGLALPIEVMDPARYAGRM